MDYCAFVLVTLLRFLIKFNLAGVVVHLEALLFDALAGIFNFLDVDFELVEFLFELLKLSDFSEVLAWTGVSLALVPTTTLILQTFIQYLPVSLDGCTLAGILFLQIAHIVVRFCDYTIQHILELIFGVGLLHGKQGGPRLLLYLGHVECIDFGGRSVV